MSVDNVGISAILDKLDRLGLLQQGFNIGVEIFGLLIAHHANAVDPVLGLAEVPDFWIISLEFSVKELNVSPILFVN